MLVPVLCVLLAVMAVLAVDWGRVQLAKGQLQTAVDAAALHAVSGVLSDTWESRASAALSDNQAAGLPIIPGDIVAGTWDESSQALDPGGDYPDALMVAASTTVDLYFGEFVGVAEVELHATAIAGLKDSIWGLTGIDSVDLRNVVVDSYQPGAGPYSATRRNRAVVSSNGNINLDSSTIDGDLYIGPEASISGSGVVTGKVNKHAYVHDFDPVTAADWAGGYNNGALMAHLDSDRSLQVEGSTHLRIPGGTYLVKDFKIAGTATLEATGPVTIYVTGAVDLLGTMKTWANAPENLNIRVASKQKVTVVGTADFFGSIYAPTSSVTIGGTPGFFGRVVGRRLEVWGNVGVHHDETVDRFRASGNVLWQ